MAANHGNSPSIQVAMEEIGSLQKKVTTMEKERAEQNVDSDDESLIESQPLRQSLWDSKVPDNIKSPHLPTFDGKTDPVEHLMAVGTQTAIIRAPEHLRCKLLSGTLKDAALRWYMNLPNNSIESYADFQKRSYTNSPELSMSSEATIMVSNPNQEMFVATFHNGLKAGHFNESLAQKPATSMQEVIKRASCYIKGEESNAEKRSRDAKEKDSRNNNGKGPNSQHNEIGRTMILTNRADREYTPLNRARVHLLHEILQAGLTPLPPPRIHNTIMGPDTEAWCAYHRCKGHETERCFRLRDLIEDLIRSGHLRKFLEDAAKGQIALPKQTPNQQKGEGDGRNKGEKQRVAVNTMSGGFVGGGESISARKRYVRKSKLEICSVGSLNLPCTPEISFNPEDARDILPHDDDPLVIQVQILNCDVKRVLIDSGSSADILYWDAYKAIHLSDEQLNPYSDTLVGFAGEQVDVMSHITLYTTFGEDENAKTIKFRYLVVKTLFTSYNIIIGRPAFNALGAVVSTLYISIKQVGRELLFDPEIEKTAKANRKAVRLARQAARLASGTRETSKEESSSSHTSDEETKNMAGVVQPPRRTLGDYGQETDSQNPNLEWPNIHLSNFYEACGYTDLTGVSKSNKKLRLFPLSLTGRAKDWIDTLPPNTIATWDELELKFRERYFPIHKFLERRNDITNFEQGDSESLYDAWERMLLDASAGGTLMNKDESEARELVEAMTQNEYRVQNDRGAKKKASMLELDPQTALLAQSQMMKTQIAAMLKHYVWKFYGD
ncbi:hypothetical protein TSUD_137520 [Trifolium subterraneum]|uniref:Retrotransposon gag domain-containing protein n=1 Tax=Trifolium subterraneum TaxID=3900 RepID=A0A2Z6PQQ3_TRISU|nr:hypothetical protein TSUD_137520 [Trifolium subterraneum]